MKSTKETLDRNAQFVRDMDNLKNWTAIKSEYPDGRAEFRLDLHGSMPATGIVKDYLLRRYRSTCRIFECDDSTWIISYIYENDEMEYRERLKQINPGMYVESQLHKINLRIENPGNWYMSDYGTHLCEIGIVDAYYPEVYKGIRSILDKHGFVGGTFSIFTGKHYRYYPKYYVEWVPNGYGCCVIS